ncbi:hypothetical protein K8R61_01625, partial [bacterium]|nr:hypothetical protein [bacterium]
PLGFFIMPPEFFGFIKNFVIFKFGFIIGYLFSLCFILMWFVESLKYFLLIVVVNIGGYFLGKLIARFKNKHDKIKI